MTSDRTVSRLSRILALIPYLLEREVAPVEEVLERFGYTLEELSRDLNTVIVCGLPGYGPGDLMWAYMDEDDVVMDAADYFQRAPRLTPTEAMGLLASGMAVLEMGEDSPALRSAVKKLAKVLIPDSGDVLRVDVLDDTAQVSKLKSAAMDRKVTTITYRSLSKEEVTVRDIEPWSVFHTIGQWYVVGYCRMVDGERTFRVDRIQSIEVTDEHFERPETVPQPHIGYSPSESDISCVIDLKPGAEWVLDYYSVKVIDEVRGAVRVQFWAPDPETPARLLLRLGGRASLVEGEEVRARMEELGQSLLARYS